MLKLQQSHPMPHATTFEPREPSFLLNNPNKPATMHTTAMQPQSWQNSYHSNNLQYSNPQSRSYSSNDSQSTARSIQQGARADSGVSWASGAIPYSTTVERKKEEVEDVTDLDAAIPQDLKVPASITTPQRNLAQLAAEITCLFWFEEGTALRQIESMTKIPAIPLSYIPNARPTPRFREWISTLLATTQVKPNVVLLALLFIYRLKCANPTVKGKPGSEYRLLTVALMLGNKFLDDNTYTNKTWADVSSIEAREVHIMEVEFLSNMRYTLYTSEEQWKAWYISLTKFGTYISRAIAHWDDLAARSATVSPAIGVSGYGLLPSPPTSHTGSPQVFAYSPSHATRSSLLNSQLPTSFVSLLKDAPVRAGASRKRSYDEAAQEPAPKRHASAYPVQLPHPPTARPQVSQTVSTPIYPVSSMTQNLIPQLPLPAARSAYPVAHPTSQPITMPPLQTNILPQPTLARIDAPRGLSPYPLDSSNSSPLSAAFTHSAGTPSFNRLSPSYLLNQRSSPYRPVVRPHTLLAPPPAASYHNPARQVSYDQMQFHSLGRPINERQHGQIPYNPQPHQFYSPLPPLVHNAGRL